MINKPVVRSSLILILGVLCVAGCGSKAPPQFGARTVSWTSPAGAGQKPLPGIEHANVKIGIWNDGAAIVVWDDAATSGFGGHGMEGVALKPGEKRTGVKYEGNAGKLNLSCYTPDCTNGIVKIGAETYDLSWGALFLISTTGQKAVVKQLKLSAINLKPQGTLTQDQITSDRMQKAGRTEPEIREFFEEAARGKPAL